MKKQLIILFAAISLLVLAQSPQRFPGGVVAKYYQRTGSTADSVLLGNGTTKALSANQPDTIHKIATKYNVAVVAAAAEPKITPGSIIQYWAGNKTWRNLGSDVKVLFSASPPLSFSDGSFSISQAGPGTDGYLNGADWNIFNNKMDQLGYTAENTANKGLSNGYVPLDASAKIPTAYLPAAIFGALNYQGTWAASVGVYPTTVSKGYYWVISTPGILGTTYYKTNDWLTYNGTSWDKVDNQQTLSSVFGRTGAVVATTGDYNTDQVTEGTNKYYTDARARASLSFTSGSGGYNSSTGVITIPTNNNQLTNGAGYITNSALSGYALATGTNATGTWPISISGTAANATSWNNQMYTGTVINNPTYVLGYSGSNSDWRPVPQSAIQTWLGISGTSGCIPKFGSSSSLGNSLIYDNGINVGIGTINPNCKLLIADAAVPALGVYRDLDVSSVGTAGQRIEIGAKNGTVYTPGAAIEGTLSSTATTGTLTFSTRTSNSLTEKMRIDASGSIGIGTASPGYKLDVNGIVNTSSAYLINAATGATPINAIVGGKQWQLGQNAGAGGGDDTFSIYSASYGATHSYNAILKLSNDASALFAGTITSAGIMYAPNFQTTSDIRLKTKIKPIGTKQLPITYHSFYLKSDTTDLRYGVIAQEVQKIAPELVTKGKDGYLSVKYTDLLVREISALKEIVKTQEDRIVKLEKLIAK